MGALTVKLNIESKSILDDPLKLHTSYLAQNAGAVEKVRKVTTVLVGGTHPTLFAKADFTNSDEQTLVYIKNVSAAGSAINAYILLGSQEVMKLSPGQASTFVWYTDSSVGEDIKYYSDDDSTGVTIEAYAIELT